MLTRAGVLDALCAEPSGGPAFKSGLKLGVLLGVLGAEAEGAPRLRFLVLRAEADGNCLFHALAEGAEDSAEALCAAVLEGLAADWGKPCDVAGHEGRTVGGALAEDHGVALADAAAYLAFRHAELYCKPFLCKPSYRHADPYCKPLLQTLTANPCCKPLL
jgi:hypothetical protein